VNRIIGALLTVGVLATAADARPRRSSQVVYSSPVVTMPAYQSPVVAMPVPQFPVVAPVVMTQPVMTQPFVPQPMTAVPTATTGGGLAQSKAQIQAQAGRCFHPGGSLGGTHEGCGFSTVSADDAVRHCCYWGQRTPIDIGVARGANGWYATVIYR
jgi:hypothetical protein